MPAQSLVLCFQLVTSALKVLVIPDITANRVVTLIIVIQAAYKIRWAIAGLLKMAIVLIAAHWAHVLSIVLDLVSLELLQRTGRYRPAILFGLASLALRTASLPCAGESSVKSELQHAFESFDQAATLPRLWRTMHQAHDGKVWRSDPVRLAIFAAVTMLAAVAYARNDASRPVWAAAVMPPSCVA